VEECAKHCQRLLCRQCESQRHTKPLRGYTHEAWPGTRLLSSPRPQANRLSCARESHRKGKRFVQARQSSSCLVVFFAPQLFPLRRLSLSKRSRRYCAPCLDAQNLFRVLPSLWSLTFVRTRRQSLSRLLAVQWRTMCVPAPALPVRGNAERSSVANYLLLARPD